MLLGSAVGLLTAFMTKRLLVEAAGDEGHSHAHARTHSHTPTPTPLRVRARTHLVVEATAVKGPIHPPPPRLHC